MTVFARRAIMWGTFFYVPLLKIARIKRAPHRYLFCTTPRFGISFTGMNGYFFPSFAIGGGEANTFSRSSGNWKPSATRVM